MSQKVGSLVVEMSANVASLKRDFDSAYRQSQHISRRLSSLFRSLGFSLAAGLSVRSLQRAINASIKAADQARKTAQAVGLTTEAFTGLSFAARLSGVDTGALTTSLTRLNAVMGEAAAGGRTQAAIFRALNVEIQDAEGNMRAGDEVLKDLADRFASMPDGVDKSAAAVRIFGRAGAQMIPLLNQGADGIAKLTEQAEKLGVVITDKTARQAEQFNDTMFVLSSTMRGMTNQITASMLPTLNDLAGALLDINNEGVAAAGIGDLLAGILKGVAATAVGAAAAIHLTGKSVAGLMAAVDAATQGQRWYDSLFPALGFRRIIKNWEDVRDQASIVGDDLVSTIDAYAKVLDRIWAAGTTEDNRTAERIKETADFLRALREELGRVKDETAVTLPDIAVSQTMDPLQRRAREIFEAVKTPFERFKELRAELEWLLSAQYIDQETYSRALRQITDDYKATIETIEEETARVSEFWSEAMRSMQRVASDFFFNAMKGEFKSLGDAFLDMVNRMIADWASVQLMTGLFGADFGSGGSLGGVIGGLFSGTRAAGGPVTGGSAYLVGEMGPEVFIPQTSGNIMANMQAKQEAVPHSTNVFIHAADAKSFEDMCRRNPQAIIGQIEEGLRLGNRGLRNSLRNGG